MKAVLRCKKCGSPDPPESSAYKAAFKHGCVPGVCPNSEHLHLTCACGYSGISPCVDQKELGTPFTPEPIRWLRWRSVWSAKP